MAFEGKAKADAQSRHGGMSILHKPPDRHWRDGLKYKAKAST
jgi:hypothetical protein